MSPKTYLAAPQDMRKVGSLEQLQNMPNVLKIHGEFYDVFQSQFPLMPTEFDSQWGGNIRLMSSIQNTTTCPGRQTNLIGGLSVDVPFLVTRISMIAFGETKKFTLPGQLVPRASVAGTCPAVGPCADGSIAGAEDAALYWGGAIDQFIVNVFQRFRLQFAIGRFLLVDDSLFDIGHLPPPCFDGASDSLAPAASYVKEVNDVLAGKGCSKMFLPQNSTAGSLCVGAPTAAVTYGCVTIGSKRPYCLNPGILLLPGWPINVELVAVENDCCFLPAMRRNSVLDCAATPQYDDSLAAGCGSATVPGGCLSFGIELGGVYFTPECCLQFAQTYGYGVMGQMLSGNPYLGGIINDPNIRARALQGLSGVQADDFKRFLGSPAIPTKTG
jgi:hypothetical protein